MGGYGAGEAGEVASKIAVDAVNQQVGERDFPRGVNQFSQLTPDEQKDWLSGVVNQANRAILEQKETSRVAAERDMGTTLVMAVRFGDQVLVANAGDSRAYMVSADGKIPNQISRDHSLVAILVKDERITPAQARIHPERNRIYRSLGDKYREETDVFFAKIPAGGSLLLCSDGLWGMIEDEEIREIVVSSESAQEAARRLIEAANVAGGKDNISAVVVKRKAEEELKMIEKVFVAKLEDLVDLENPAAAIDEGQLKKYFDGLKSQFSQLLAGGRLRAKVMETVAAQLGEKEKQLKKAGKRDEEIFEEWLKQVFIPLYRRAKNRVI
jgi:serine/threonine protein phosphatase PrpC